MSQLVRQKIAVHLDGRDEPLEIITDNRDLVRWDVTRAKHKWPNMDEAPMLWATFVSWSAAKRGELYAGTWEEWSNRDCVSVDFDEADLEEVDPTRPAAAPSSESP